MLDQASSGKITAVLVDKDPQRHAAVRRALQHADGESEFLLEVFEDLPSAMATLAKLPAGGRAVVVCDAKIDEPSGMKWISNFMRVGVAPVIVISGSQDERLAEEALRQGATDYVAAPSNQLDPVRLNLAIKQSLIRFDLEQRNLELASEIRCVNVELERRNELLVGLTDAAHRFVDDVSHELRTPLAVIKEFTELVSDGVGGPVTEQQSEWLQTISIATVDLNHMVEDFLDSSKLKAGRLRVDRRPHRIEDIFAGVQRLLARKLAARKLRIVKHVEPNLVPVFVDDEKVRRIIMNLLSNAIKFSSDGSEIGLSARRLETGDVEVTVRDHGPGLAPSDLALLFERFRQLPNVLTASVKGFGLGLNIARQLVWLNLGRIGASSVQGQGASFWFTLPPDAPEIVIERFFDRIAECEEPPRMIEALLVRPTDPAQSPSVLRRLLAAITKPSDIIVARAEPTSMLLCGPVHDAHGWMAALRRRIANSGNPQWTERGVDLTIVGSWKYPEQLVEAKSAILANVLSKADACLT